MSMNHKENPKGPVRYWWFRYILSTELYIVEKWEQATIHVILALLFAGLWWFNSMFVLRFVERLINGGDSVAASAAKAGQYPPITSSLILDMAPERITS